MVNGSYVIRYTPEKGRDEWLGSSMIVPEVFDIQKTRIKQSLVWMLYNKKLRDFKK